MSLIIHFIGLVTFVSAVSDVPAHILIPYFDKIVPKENNVIRIPNSVIVEKETDWLSQSGPNGTTDFFIKTQNITLEATGDFSQNFEEGLPHLACCCVNMKPPEGGLSPDYNDHDKLDKKSAYVFLDHGEVGDECPQGKCKPTDAVHLKWTVSPLNGRIKIIGKKNPHDPKPQVIVLRVTNNVDIGFLNVPAGEEHDSHWKSYYDMAKIHVVNCEQTPKDNPTTCSTKPTDCRFPNTGLARTAATKTQGRHAASPPCPGCPLTTDINCSSSQWP
jgi:hypothetical protein